MLFLVAGIFRPWSGMHTWLWTTSLTSI